MPWEVVGGVRLGTSMGFPSLGEEPGRATAPCNVGVAITTSLGFRKRRKRNVRAESQLVAQLSLTVAWIRFFYPGRQEETFPETGPLSVAGLQRTGWENWFGECRESEGSTTQGIPGGHPDTLRTSLILPAWGAGGAGCRLSES